MWKTSEIGFWKERLDEARSKNHLVSAIGVGFDFTLIDKIHKEIVRGLIGPDDSVLDFGCGIGRVAGWFSDKQYTGVDFFEGFISEAWTAHPNKKFLVADVKKLPFADKEFDWAIGISMKAMILRDTGRDEWEKIQKELTRVAKHILILEYGNSKEEEIKKYELI